MPDGERMLIGLPTIDGKVVSQLAEMLIELAGLMIGYGIRIKLLPLNHCATMAAARSLPMTYWVEETSAEYYLSLDADMVVSPGQILRLVASGHEFALASAPTKVEPPRWAGNLPRAPMIQDGWVEMLDCGLCCALLRRSVADKMRQAFPDKLRWGSRRMFCWFDRVIDGQRYIEEDQSFCRRWRSIGGQIWGDLAAGSGHVGTKTYECGTYGQWLDNQRRGCEPGGIIQVGCGAA